MRPVEAVEILDGLKDWFRDQGIPPGLAFELTMSFAQSLLRNNGMGRREWMESCERAWDGVSKVEVIFNGQP